MCLYVCTMYIEVSVSKLSLQIFSSSYVPFLVFTYHHLPICQKQKPRHNPQVFSLKDTSSPISHQFCFFYQINIIPSFLRTATALILSCSTLFPPLNMFIQKMFIESTILSVDDSVMNKIDQYLFS